MARGLCPMCLAEFLADAPYKQHFLDAHGLDDDPGTETRLPEDAPPPEPEPEPEPPKKRRLWGAGSTASSLGAPVGVAGAGDAGDGDAGAEPVDARAAPGDVPDAAHERTAGERAAEAAGDLGSAVTTPEPVVVIPAAEPEPEPVRPRAVRAVTVAGAIVVVIAFLIAAGRLTGGDEPARAADVPATTVPAPAVPAPAPPPGPAGEQYVVVRGDSLSRIARRLGVRLEDLVAANGIANPNLIHAGQLLTVPR